MYTPPKKTNTRPHGTTIAIRKNIDYMTPWRIWDWLSSHHNRRQTRTNHNRDRLYSTQLTLPAPHRLFILTQTTRPCLHIRWLKRYRHYVLGHADSNPVGCGLTTLINQDRCRYLGPQFPTLMPHNSTTSQDIVIANNQTFHNCKLQPGPMISSDHISIIATTISCNQIAILIKPRRQFRKAE